MRWIVTALAFAVSCCGCTPVDGDRVTGADLARADARFAGVPETYTAGFAPMPGLRRVFDVREMMRIARLHAITVDGITPACFERTAEPLTGARIEETLRRLVGAGTRIEIIEFSRHPVAKGEIVFSLKDLPRPPGSDADAPVVWRGKVQYSLGGSAVVWAKVRVLKEESWVESAVPIAPWTPIRPEQIVTRTGWRFPLEPTAIRDGSAVVGRVATRTILKGRSLTATMLGAPREVQAGDTVEVEVAAGGVSLRFSAPAVSGGRKDDVVLVTMESGKKVKARIQGKGRVVIDADIHNKEAMAARAGVGAAARRPAGGLGGSQAEEVEPTVVAAGTLSR